MNNMMWVSSREAVRMLLFAGIPVAGTLASWGEKGLLRARYEKAWREGEEDDFPTKPFVPADFWRWVDREHNSRSNWGVGEFSANVRFEVEIGVRGWLEQREHWRIHGVCFCHEDIEKQIAATGAAPRISNLAKMPDPRWCRRKPTRQEFQVYKFFGSARSQLPGREREISKKLLRERYVAHIGKTDSQGKPLKRTAFEQALSRYLQGFRIVDGAFCNQPDEE